jgi:heterokaryon incompatibility protein (HET)
MNSDNAASGVYSALDVALSQIRVLVLETGHFNDPISCSLAVVSLKDQPVFTALSYVWGSPTPAAVISINGQDAEITPNLASVLRHIRYSGTGSAQPFGKFLWIDAICINQADMKERGQQVSLMGDIYRQAALVLIWLGEGDEHSNWAFDRLKDPEFRATTKTLKTSARPPTSDEIRLKVIIDRNIEERRYWTRIWVLQEMVLAKNDPAVLCGQKYAYLSEYIEVRNNLPANKTSHPEAVPEWNHLVTEIPRHRDFNPGRNSQSVWHDVVRGIYRDFGSISMSNALSVASHFEATDTRDQVYGVLGMLPSDEASAIMVDYGKDYMAVTQDAIAVALTSKSSDADALDGFTRFSGYRPVDAYPSWVPDLKALVISESTKRTSGLQRPGGSWRRPQRAKAAIVGGTLKLGHLPLRHDRRDSTYGFQPRVGGGLQVRNGAPRSRHRTAPKDREYGSRKD